MQGLGTALFGRSKVGTVEFTKRRRIFSFRNEGILTRFLRLKNISNGNSSLPSFSLRLYNIVWAYFLEEFCSLFFLTLFFKGLS